MEKGARRPVAAPGAPEVPPKVVGPDQNPPPAKVTNVGTSLMIKSRPACKMEKAKLFMEAATLKSEGVVSEPLKGAPHIAVLTPGAWCRLCAKF